MRFLNREDLSLTPALGEAAAEAFYDETKFPNTLRRAVLNDGDVSLATLRAWGEQAHVEAEVETEEAKCLYGALHGNPIRSRTAAVLLQHPPREKDTELDRLKRVGRALNGGSELQGLKEAIQCIQEFEGCYRLVTLTFERLLWLCRHHAASSVKMSELKEDFVLKAVRDTLPVSVKHFIDLLDNGENSDFRQNLVRLSDVRQFLEEASAAVGDIDAFIKAIVARHTDVQHGKFDRGRRKMPWIQLIDGHITLTMTRAGGMSREVTLPEHIQAHPYRLNAADAFNRASVKGAEV